MKGCAVSSVFIEKYHENKAYRVDSFFHSSKKVD